MSHFDYPFAFGNTTKNTKEVVQDSIEDVVNSVEVILATELGFRPDHPDFGIPDQVFELQPLDLEDLIQIVENQEPRAQVIMEQITVPNDPLVNRLTASVALRKANSA